MAHQTSDPQWISEQLRFLARQFNRTLTPDALTAYSRSISRFPQDAVRRVIRRCSEECRVFPPLAEILSRLDDYAGPASKHQQQPDLELSSRKDIASRAQKYLEACTPFALVKSPYPDLLMPIPFSQQQRDNWLRVCERLPDWPYSDSAQGNLPPCLAVHTQPDITDCDDQQFLKCTRKLVGYAPKSFETS